MVQMTMAKNPRLIDLTGQKFGRWTVERKDGNDARGGAKWSCKCECGVVRSVLGADLRAGKSVSCGCYRSQTIGALRRTHAASGSRLHRIWKLMRGRCLRPSNPKFYAYGARGILICPEWGVFENFQTWAVSNGYADTLTIERKDVDGHYEPSNCCWVPAEAQSLNRRISLRAADGELWLHKARRNGVKDAAFRRRIFDGWSPEEASSVPMNVRRNERSRDDRGRYA